MVNIHLTAGGRSLPVEMRQHKGRIFLKFRNYAPLRKEVKSMRAARWHPEDAEWSVKDCPRNWIQIQLLAGDNPKELERYDETLTHTLPQRPKLYEHQKRMLDFMLTRRRCIVAAEMGTGKTLTVIEAMEHVGGKWLYVAPAKVLTAVKMEFNKWDAKVTPQFVSYASLRKTLENWKGRAPHGVVFDESSRLKSPGAQRTKAAQYLADAIREERDGYVILMTGTPTPKAPTDWWSQAEIACPGFLRESSRNLLEARMAIIEKMTIGDKSFGKIVGWKKDEVELLGRRMIGLAHVLYSKDCIDLPEIRYETVEFEPDDEALATARLVSETAETAAAALTSLRQISDGFIYGADKKPVRMGTPKDAALEGILDQHDEVGRIIIYAGFRASVDRVVDLCQFKGWAVVRCDGRGWWPRSEYKDLLAELDRSTDTRTFDKVAFVANPGSGGMGLTLTAAPSAVYYSQDFNAESRFQSLKRGHRNGMDVNRGFTVYDLLHLPTDRLILENIDQKKTLQSITMEEIKKCLT